MRHSIVTATRGATRCALGAALLLALLAPVNCTPDEVVAPEPPPPPPVPCSPVINAVRLEGFGPLAYTDGSVIAILGADVGFTAVASGSCIGAVVDAPTWSTSDSSVIRFSSTLTNGAGFTAVSVGQAIVSVEWAGARAAIPVEVPPIPEIGRLRLLTAGAATTCALNDAGQTLCWGGNQYNLVSGIDPGVTGGCPVTRYPACRPLPFQRPNEVALDQLETRGAQACGLADGVAWCWGAIATGGTSPGLQRVPGVTRFREVSVGAFHACGLDDQGEAFCWGSNAFGQLGNESTMASSQPVRVSGDRRYATIAAGNISTCAVTVASTLYCWGDVVEGAGPSAQCGGGPKSGPTPCWLVPIRVSLALTGADSVLRSLSLGSHACALSTGGRTYCWGGDPFTLGVNSNTNRVPAPSPVETALRFESISVGGRRTCGLVLGGEAYCWGPSSSAFAIRSSPEAVAGGLHFQSITVGDDHTCGLTLDGKGYCWGENSLGQLGTGSRSPSSVPALILGQ